MCRAPAGIAGAYRAQRGRARLAGVLALKALFWLTLAALLWTHVLYPLGAAALARRAHSGRAEGRGRADGDA